MKKKYLWIPFAIVCGALLGYVVFGCSSPKTVDNSTVSEFNLQRFLGKWYELARFDHRFERGMEKCITVYTQNEDGTVKVENQGWKNGELEEARGKAKLTNTPGLLRVSFFGPFYSDYRVMMLAPDYSYALVGSGTDDYLWIMSRTPTLPQSTMDAILDEARHRGYDTSKLIWM